MTSFMTAFITAVEKSRVLNAEQKRELLDNPKLLPEGYRAHLIEILVGYDARARGREEEVRKRIETALQRFAQELDAEDIADEDKQVLLAKSRKQLSAIIQNTPMS